MDFASSSRLSEECQQEDNVIGNRVRVGANTVRSIMSAAIIVTYRCNARCTMCHTWQHPTRPSEEVSLNVIRKLPTGLGSCNVTGGEPMLRDDIEEIVAVLSKKAKRVEISTNGYFTDRIVELGKKYPNLSIRVSIEGLPSTNDKIRGLNNGFDKALRTILRLKEIGMKNIGFATVIQDRNAKDLLDVFRLTDALDVEFAQAVPHNSFYFHKYNNQIANKELVTREIKHLISCFLGARRPKLWFRAYLNRGLIQYVNDGGRLFPCTAGTDIFFLDPYGEVYPCNVMQESMGNLKTSSFEDIWCGARANEVRRKILMCRQNCWMTGTAVPAMKRHFLSCLLWVGKNKMRRLLGQDIVLE